MLRKVVEWTMILTLVRVMGLDVDPGDNVTLECIYDPNEYRVGISILRFWLRDNGTGEASAVSMNNKILVDGYEMKIDDYFGEYNLVISNASLQLHNGTFRCHVQDREENTKTRVKSEIPVIIMNQPSVPVISPRSPIVEKGYFIEVNCSTVGGNPSPIILWLNEDKTILEPGEDESFTSEMVMKKNVHDPAQNVFTSILKIKGKREDHDRNFLCSVWNSAMKDNRTSEVKMKLNVHYPAIISITPYGDFNIEEYSNISFGCTIDANPPIYLFFWTFKGSFLHQRKTFDMHNIKAKDTGMYECYAVNRIGEGTPKNETYMEVLHRPLHNHSSEVKVTEGSRVKISCAVRARPLPYSTMWYKYGNSSFRHNGTELKFKSVKQSDQGFYACESRNILYLTVLGTRYEKEVERTTRTNLSLIVQKADKIPLMSTTTAIPCVNETTPRISTTSLPSFPQLTDVVYDKKSKLLYFLVLGKVPVFVKVDVKYEGEKEWKLYNSFTVLTQQFSLALLPTKYGGQNSSNTKDIHFVKVQACQTNGVFCGKNHHAQIYGNEQEEISWILYLLWFILTFIVVALIASCSFISCLYAFVYFYRRKFLHTSVPIIENPIQMHIHEENPNADPDAIQAVRCSGQNQNCGQAIPFPQVGSIFRFQRPRIASVLV